MALKTIPFRELEKHTNDMFEAVTIIAKRARQITADRFIIREEKRREEESMEDITIVEELEERSPDYEQKKIEFDKIDKPVSEAVDELLSNNLEWKHPLDFEAEKE